MRDWLLAPWSYQFMQTGLAGAVMVAVICGSVGVYVVIRRMAFVSGALAHAILPGLVIALIVGVDLFAGALVAGVVAAVLIATVSRGGAIREDTAIGVVMTSMFALGVGLATAAGEFRDITGLLFGDILGIGVGDLVALAIIGVVSLGALALFGKELRLASVDPGQAATAGLSVDRVRLGFLIVVALAVIAGIQSVGVVLTGALLIVPAATAVLLARSIGRLIVIAVGIAVLASVAGLYLSFYLSVAAGAAIVLTCAVIFAGVGGVRWFLR